MKQLTQFFNCYSAPNVVARVQYGANEPFTLIEWSLIALQWSFMQILTCKLLGVV